VVYIVLREAEDASCRRQEAGGRRQVDS